jgi:hypothetical protein
MFLLAFTQILVPGTARSQTAGTLQLTIVPGKTELVVGEPLFVILRLRNIGSASIDVPDSFRTNSETLLVLAAAGSGAPRPYRPLALVLTQSPPLALAPGEEITELAAIFFGGSGWYVVDHEGTYRVHARYRVPTPGGPLDVSSEPVTVTVSAGDGAGRMLIDDDHGGEAAKFLLWQAGDHLERGIAHLTDVAATHPNSPLADYIRVAFARSHSRPFKNYAIDVLRPPDCPRALEELNRVRPASLPTQLKLQMSLDRARCLIALNRRGDASGELASALRIIDEEPAFRPLLEQAVQLEPTLLQTGG